MVDTNVYYLLFGGNESKSLELFCTAEQLLSENGVIIKKSAIYQSEPWGFSSDKLFYNQAIEYWSTLSPLSLLDRIHTIEKTLGRIRQEDEQYTDRPIDIDILLYNSDVFENYRLSIPHKQLHLRGFALAPIADLIPDYQHPIIKKSIHELYVELKDFTPKKYLC